MNDEQQAKMYDEMINWDGRLAREMPKIVEFLPPGLILDVACSSGRHSLALAERGYSTIGVDISAPFIKLAKELAKERGLEERSRFMEIDATEHELLEELSGMYMDGAILLGNAIANMGSFDRAQALIRHIFVLLRPGGKFFVQTIHRPSKPWYNPLRRRDDTIIQRIMVPEHDATHNVVLHVNQIEIDGEDGPNYLRQTADNEFFMFTREEFQSLVEDVGFEVEAVYHHYSDDPVKEEDGETQTWRLVKPEIELLPEGILLFEQYANIGEQEIRARTLEIWQDLMRRQWYHCLRGYRFLYPRITSHPSYQEIATNHLDKPILDVACNTGTDLRQLYVDGASELIGVDREDTFIEAGYVLFGDRESCPIDFHIFDILSDDFLKIKDSSVAGGEFTKYEQHFGVIHAGSLLHLLDQASIIDTVERMYYLLQENGIFFGRTVGLRTPGLGKGGLRYLHNIETLTEVFENAGYRDVSVVEMPRGGPKGETSNDTVLQLGFYARR